ncbi:MAG: pilus assembly protein PilM [Candidatus Omnitrophica bacterium]|nr:pilus assembly protein PilM [Candidatus Omnitrophota bacterium]
MDKAALIPQILELQKSLARGKTVIGIDIGFSSVNVAQAAFYQGKPTIIKAVSKNIGVVEEKEREGVTRDALKGALADFDTTNADVVCTVSNQNTIVDYLTMPPMPDSEILEAIKIEVNNAQRFSIQTPLFDFQVAGPASVKSAERISVMVAVVAKSAIDSLLSYFKPSGQNKRLELNLTKVIPMSIALENIIKKSKLKIKETIVTLEMGSMFAELNVYRDGHLEFSRKINVTGNDFTRCLTSALSTIRGKVELTFQEAEAVKREFGIPSSGEEFLIEGKITANQAISLLRPKLELLVKEITRAFDLYYDQHAIGKLDKLVLWGSGTMLKRLPEFLNAELGIPVQIGDPLVYAEFLYEGMLDDLKDKHKLTSAIGASLADPQGINLLPEGLRDFRKKFAQKLIMGASSGVLVLLSVFFYLLLLLRLNGIQQESVKLESEYKTLMPHISDIKNKLLIRHVSYHRLDIGGVLGELSYLPQDVYLSDLSLTDGKFALSGIVSAQSRDSKRILKPFVVELERISGRGYKISIDEDPKDKNRSIFKIEAAEDETGSHKV